MNAPTTGRLAVPGASLYYEVRGGGPAVLLIATGNGDAARFGPMADRLAERYTVISYDRRGFSRSPIRGPVDDAHRLDADAEDACRLLAQVTGEPARVFGACSGAIVGLAMAQRFPDRVRTLVAHEPPLVSVLPDAAHWLRVHAELYATYRDAGLAAARDAFRAYAGLDGDTRPPPGAELPPHELVAMLARLRRNQAFWFEHELLTYPAYRPDLAALAAVSDRLVLAVGTTSRDHHACRPAAVLAERLGTGVVAFPGGHVGHVTHPFAYAGALARVFDPPAR